MLMLVQALMVMVILLLVLMLMLMLVVLLMLMLVADSAELPSPVHCLRVQGHSATPLTPLGSAAAPPPPALTTLPQRALSGSLLPPCVRWGRCQ